MKIKGRLREGKSHQEADLKGFKQNRDTILRMEKGEGRVRFFIQKTGTIPITGILRNLKKKKKKKNPLSKNKNKQTKKKSSSSGSLPETGADNLLPGKRQTSKYVTPVASAFTHKPCFSPG